jgi:hypothetical protein
VIHEANGAKVNPHPVAHVFDFSLGYLGAVPVPNIEFRVTDATELDRDGRFWVINYFYPPESDKLDPANDLWAIKFGEGPSHAKCATVERLLQFRYTEQGILKTDVPPIQLQLVSTEVCRNWEGLVRLPGRGFLLVTDKYPETILGFLPQP